MNVALVALGVLLFPLVGLGLLLWLTHLEETLPRDVGAALRSPTPSPILAMPVRSTPAVVPAPASSIPQQRPAPSHEVAGQAFSRSTAISLGGSTNR